MARLMAGETDSARLTAFNYNLYAIQTVAFLLVKLSLGYVKSLKSPMTSSCTNLGNSNLAIPNILTVGDWLNSTLSNGLSSIEFLTHASEQIYSWVW